MLDSNSILLYRLKNKKGVSCILLLRSSIIHLLYLKIYAPFRSLPCECLCVLGYIYGFFFLLKGGH